MLEKAIASAVKEAVKNSLGIDITWEETCRMQPVAQSPHSAGLTILALQKGDLTILVWLKFNEVLGCVQIVNVKSCAW